MRLAAIFAIALGGAGCVQNGLDLTWSISLDGAPASCSVVNATDVRVISTATTGGMMYIDRFVCADGKGVTQAFTEGDYNVQLDLLDATDAVLDSEAGANGGSVHVKSGGLVKLPLVQFALVTAPTGGQLSASWKITQGGVDTTCAAVNATQVEFLATDAQMQPHSFLFACDALTGTTPVDSLPAGSYTVVLNLLDASMGLLSMSAPTPEVVMAGTDTQMGLFTFAL